MGQKTINRYKIELNSAENVRDLLQETYRLADEQIVQAQTEINKLSNATMLQEETIEGKAKYAKAINDYMGMKDKAIKVKLDIAKLLTEIMTHNGNVKSAMEDGESHLRTSFDPNRLQEVIEKTMARQNDKGGGKTVIELKNK